jgi:hypothetical protein
VAVVAADPLVDELPARLSSGDRAALYIRRLVFEGRLRSGDRNFFKWVPGSIELEKTGLVAIARAIRVGDADGAVAGYEDMLRRQSDLVVTLLDGRGFFDGVTVTLS